MRTLDLRDHPVQARLSRDPLLSPSTPFFPQIPSLPQHYYGMTAIVDDKASDSSKSVPQDKERQLGDDAQGLRSLL